MRAYPCVVDLSDSDEDDDDDVVCLTEFPAHLSQRSSRQAAKDVKLAVNDDLEILEYFGKTIQRHFEDKQVEKPTQKSSQTSSLLDDDCCILEDDPSKVDVVNSSGVNDSEDLVVTGESGPVACRDFPHARHLCVHFPFKSTAHRDFCSQCHCYVCDILAPCVFWGDGTQGGDHCHASDKAGENWKLFRDLKHSQNKALLPGRPPVHQVPASSNPSSAVNGNSGAQSACLPAYYGHLFSRSKELVAQADGILSDLFGPDRLNKVSNLSGDSASNNNASRGFSVSPWLNRGNVELSSQRNLPRSHPSDLARMQYPLQINLRSCTRDPNSHSRAYHSQDLGVQRKIPKYVRRRPDLHSSRLYVNGDHVLLRRPQRNGSFQNHQNRSVTGLIPNPKTSQSMLAAFLQRSRVESSVMQEPDGGSICDLNLGLDGQLLTELSSSPPASLSSHQPVASVVQQQQCHDAETSSEYPFHFENDAPQSLDEVHLCEAKTDATAGWSCCNSLLEEDSQFNTSIIAQKNDGVNEQPFLCSPPPLLVDYLLDGADLWNELPPTLL